MLTLRLVPLMFRTFKTNVLFACPVILGAYTNTTTCRVFSGFKLIFAPF